MGYIFIRAMIAIYTGLVLYFVIGGVSKAAFMDGSLPERRKKLLAYLAISLVWPLALFSPEGRRVLFNQFDKL